MLQKRISKLEESERLTIEKIGKMENDLALLRSGLLSIKGGLLELRAHKIEMDSMIKEIEEEE